MATPAASSEDAEPRTNLPTEYLDLSYSEAWVSVTEADQAEFQQFCDARVSQLSVKLMAVFFTIVNIYFYTMGLLNARSWYFMAAIIMSLFVIRTPLLAVLFHMKKKLRQGTNSSIILACAPWIPFFTNMLIMYSALALGLYLIARVVNGECKKLDQEHMWGCDSEHASHALPQDVLLCLFFVPLLFAISFKSIAMKYVFCSWVIIVTCIAIAIGIGGDTQSIPTLLIYIPSSLLMLYEIHRQNVVQFLVAKKQHRLLDENRRMSEEAHTELRFMIANMAHDLKTPLSAFINGVETLSSLVGELNRSTTAEKSKDLFVSIKDNIKNLFNVNQFMTMTVNRCIDYMKASKGIKLEPRLETINLQEVLSMPLNCMRDLQSRIAIIQRPIPVNVCSHIITDLQWFQENLFCLISNAVKYSSHGNVTVSVMLANWQHPLLLVAKDKKHRGRSQSVPGSVTQSELESITDSYSFLDNMHPTNGKRAATPTKLERLENGEFMKSHDHGRRPSASLFIGKKKHSLESMHSDQPSDTSLSHDCDEFLLVEVEDTGIGLSDEVKMTLFTPFKQAQRRAGGTGLGLYSLAKRVDALGGYYGVSNRRDGEQGSIFWFAIPYRPDVASSAVPTEKAYINFRALAHSASTGAGTIASIQHNSSSSSIPSIATIQKMSEDSVAEGINTAIAVTVQASSSNSNHSSGGSASVGGDSSSRSTPSAGPVTAVPVVEYPAPGKLRILLVDDSLTVLKMTSNLLKRHGHVVDQEENGADALARLERTRISSGTQTLPPYDVMLIDLNMPVMDGLEATKRLREVEKTLNALSGGGVRHHQKVFAFSANSDRSTMAEAMEAGADDFISKPFSIQTFQEKCDRMFLVK